LHPYFLWYNRVFIGIYLVFKEILNTGLFFLKGLNMAYIPHTSQDIKEMLAAIGKKSLEELFQGIPEDVRLQGEYNLPSKLSEPEVLCCLQKLATKNKTTDEFVSFMGAGTYEHFIPVLIDAIVGRSEFTTSYTPYQPEGSQGTLQTIFEYQTAICNLTGMDISNASIYDGATSLAEAVLLAHTYHKKKRKHVYVPAGLHPEYRRTLHTYLINQDIEIHELPSIDGKIDIAKSKEVVQADTATIVIAQPNFFGVLEDVDEVVALAQSVKALSIMVVDPVSLGMLKTPGEYDIDIAVGDGQPLGIPMCYGGPSFGFFAAKQQYLRQIPGRIVGQTVDGNNERGFVLTIQTREQHIKREKATSNICSNQALMALRGLIYLSALGKEGFYEVADQCFQKAHYLADELSKIQGFSLAFSAPFFREFVLHCPIDADKVLAYLYEHNIYGGVALEKWFPERKNDILIAVTECRTREQMDRLVELLKNMGV